MPTPSIPQGNPEMMNVIPSDRLDEPVRRFLTGLDVGSEVTLIELGGRQVYLMARIAGESPARDQAWSRERDVRRNNLIDRQVNETITLEEAVELAGLQSAFSRWLDANAPLPLAHVRTLHNQLVEDSLGRNGSE